MDEFKIVPRRGEEKRRISQFGGLYTKREAWYCIRETLEVRA